MTHSRLLTRVTTPARSITIAPQLSASRKCPAYSNHSSIDQRHVLRGVTVARRDALGGDFVDPLEVFGREFHVSGCRVLFEVLPPLGARNGDDVIALRHHPRQREL